MTSVISSLIFLYFQQDEFLVKPVPKSDFTIAHRYWLVDILQQDYQSVVVLRNLDQSVTLSWADVAWNLSSDGVIDGPPK